MLSYIGYHHVNLLGYNYVNLLGYNNVKMLGYKMLKYQVTTDKQYRLSLCQFKGCNNVN